MAALSAPRPARKASSGATSVRNMPFPLPLPIFRKRRASIGLSLAARRFPPPAWPVLPPAPSSRAPVHPSTMDAPPATARPRAVAALRGAKAVVFDLDDTLINWRQAEHAAIGD